jgi:hypothetical protein
MQKIVLFWLFIISVTTVGQIPTPTLNFGITSHNEPGEDYSTNANYRPVRDTLQRIVDLINSKSAKYNMQLSVNFVQGCLTHEAAASTSTDVIEYAYKMGGMPYGNVVEIDPRFKAPAPYSIADVSYSIALTGAQASKVVGGFVYYNNSSSTYTVGDWLTYTTTINGIQNATSWKADIIWGAGSIPPHSKDLNNYGVWKPRGKADSVDFYCHNPSQTVWNQGNGCSWVLTPTTNVNMMISEIRTEATKIKNGTYPANKFYNASLMINFKDFGVSAATPTFQMPVVLSRVLDSMNVLAGGGLINWKTITQKQTAFSTWSVTTGIASSQWKCGQTVTLAPTCNLASVNELIDEDGFLKVYPNPASNELTYEFQSLTGKETYFYVYDNLGRIVIKQTITESVGKVSLENLPSGLYLIQATSTRPKKLLITK